MTTADIATRVQRITQEAHRGDFEAAHSLEDTLRDDVLHWLGAHAPEPYRSLAALAATTSTLDFPRWCA